MPSSINFLISVLTFVDQGLEESAALAGSDPQGEDCALYVSVIIIGNCRLYFIPFIPFKARSYSTGISNRRLSVSHWGGGGVALSLKNKYFRHRYNPY